MNQKDKLSRDLLDLIDNLKENEACAKQHKNSEGERAFQFSRIALEETLKRNGIHIGRLIDIT